jgi:hypothetical protein
MKLKFVLLSLISAAIFAACSSQTVESQKIEARRKMKSENTKKNRRF